MELICQPSGKAALQFVRKFICPMASPSATFQRFSHMHGFLGKFMPAFQYLSVKLPQMDEYYRLAALIFDEMKITNGQAHHMFSPISNSESTNSLKNIYYDFFFHWETH